MYWVAQSFNETVLIEWQPVKLHDAASFDSRGICGAPMILRAVRARSGSERF